MARVGGRVSAADREVVVVTAAQAVVHEAARQARSSPRVRGKVHTQWLALSAALVVLSGVLVAWGLSRAADRVQVVQVVHEVKAGHVLQAGDLTVTGVAYDGAVHGLVPAASLNALVGRVAAIDLSAGELLQVGMWSKVPPLNSGEERVGAVLPAGRFPVGLAYGDIAVAASTDVAAKVEVVAVRVLDAQEQPDGGLSVTLAVDQSEAVAIAQLAATDQLLLVARAAEPRS